MDSRESVVISHLGSFLNVRDSLKVPLTSYTNLYDITIMSSMNLLICVSFEDIAVGE